MDTAPPIPAISVVIPMRNEAANIGRCLEALASQECMPFEVIVVDNDSTDTSREIVSNCASDFPGLNLVLAVEKRRGPAAARNKGIELASGVVIAFTDADCVPDKYWIQQICNAFNQDETLDAVGGVERPFSQPSTLIHKVVSATWLPPSERLRMRVIDNKNEWLEGVFISTFNCAIKRSCLEAIGGFDELFYPCGEDMDLWFRVLARGAKIVAWNPAIIVEHHQALSMRALARKMFFYGEALAHLSGQHYRGRFFILSRWFGVTQIHQPWITGIIWNQTVMAFPALVIILAIGSLSLTLFISILVLFAVSLALKLSHSMLKRGFRVTLLELPVAVGIYCLRTVAREIGLCYGSVKHRVLCI